MKPVPRIPEFLRSECMKPFLGFLNLERVTRYERPEGVRGSRILG